MIQKRSENNQENNSLKKQRNLATPIRPVYLDNFFFYLDYPLSFRVEGSDDLLVVAASYSLYFNFLREGTILRTFDPES